MRFLLVTLCLLGALCTIFVGAQPTSATSSTSAASSSAPAAAAAASSTAAAESLPPDTFRKLAQALYQRGDKAANRLNRKFFYNDNVTCNDGSVAGFYIRRNYNSKKWIIFLEGGWICHDEESCSGRASREHFRMSSDRWPSVKTVGGILSADPDENPHFADANHVFVPYCSSDAWSGTKKGHGNKPSFLGHYIMREVIRELADFEQLLFHEELYLAGGSAGGVGVLNNVDMVADMVGPAGLQVRGIVDSGWFLDNDPFTSDCSHGAGGKCSVITDFIKGVKMWNARVPKRCADAYPGEEWKCFLGYRIYPLIQSPLFIIQWQFDTFQMYADNVALPTSRDQWNYIHQGGNHLRNTFNNVTAVFAPSCIAHEVVTMSYWTQVQVNQVSLPDAIQCWTESLPPPKPATIEAGEYRSKFMEMRDQVDDRFLAKKNDMAMATGLHSRSASMLSDSPSSYKLASNLIRSISSGSSGVNVEDSRNSITSHLDRRRGKKDQKKRPNRHRKNGSSRRHNRKCSANSNSCSDEDLVELELDEVLAVRNGDLVRELKRPGKQNKAAGSKNKRKRNKRKRRKTNKDKKNAPKTPEQEERRRERRKRRRQERRRQDRLRRQERKQRRKQQRRLERRKLREERLFERPNQPSQDTAEGEEVRKHHLKVRSADESPAMSSSSSCQLKLIDRCSWPHCNRSCPKLKNPDTGQEIDFLTLLQSFGLNMGSVADALGVDVATLNNMDRDVLFQMLTSQQSVTSGNNN